MLKRAIAPGPDIDLELVYALRKLGVSAGVLPSPPRVASGPHGAPPTAGEQLRLRLEGKPWTRAAYVPTPGELSAVANSGEHLLFSYGGRGKWIDRALETGNLTAIELALGLRFRDPVPTTAGDTRYRTKTLPAAIARLWSTARTHAGAIEVLEHGYDAGDFDEDLILPHRLAMQHACERADVLERNAARALISPAARAYGRGETLSKTVRNEIAVRRREYWGRVDEVLTHEHWSDAELAELIMTGAGAADGWAVPIEGWAFPLCPMDCRRGPQKIAVSISQERKRAADAV